MTDQKPLDAGYRRRARRRRVEAIGYPLGALVLALALWQVIVTVFNVPWYLLPSPGAVWSTLTTQWQYLASESVPTIEEVLLGFAAATVLGIGIAIAIVTWRPFEKAVYPLLVASQEVPQIAFAPLLLVWFGFGMASKVIVAFLIAFVPIVVNSAAGLRSVSTELLDPFDPRIRLHHPAQDPLPVRAAAHLYLAEDRGDVRRHRSGRRRVRWGGQRLRLRSDDGQRQAGHGDALRGHRRACHHGPSAFTAVSLLERLMIPWHVTQRTVDTSRSAAV